MPKRNGGQLLAFSAGVLLTWTVFRILDHGLMHGDKIHEYDWMNLDGVLLAAPSTKKNESWTNHTTSHVPSSEHLIAAGSVTPTRSHILPLAELVRSNDVRPCPLGLVRMNDTILPSTSTTLSQRKIPKIIHVTSQSRCVPPTLAANLEQWRNRLEGYEFYFHDDDAVHRLLNQYWPPFPHLATHRHCISTGATLADVWRYLVLWVYGGVYTDFDNSPGKLFRKDTITDDDDGFYVLEKLGIIAQYFLASSPRHPFIYFVLQDALSALQALPDYGVNRPHLTTGPHAIKMGFIEWMKNARVVTDGYIEAGTYVGPPTTTTPDDDRRSIRVVGHKSRADEFVIRYGLKTKNDDYAAMNMSHYFAQRKPRRESCLLHMLNVKGNE